MSIQNEITRISGKVTEQTALIEEIGSILEGKAAAVPVLQEKTVRPSKKVQEIVPDSGYDGLSKVTVDALKLQNITVTPRVEYLTYIASDGSDGLGEVTVTGDNELTPDHILIGTEIFGVVGTLPEFNDTFYITKVTFTYLGSSTGTWEYKCKININEIDVVSFTWAPADSTTQKEIRTSGFNLCLSTDEIGIYGDIPTYTYSFSDNYSTLNIFSRSM